MKISYTKAMKPISIIIAFVFIVLSASSFSTTTTTTTTAFVVTPVASRMGRNTINPLLVQNNVNAITNDEGLMPILPNDVVKYSQVPKEGSFTKSTIPKGLLNRHTTKIGTWGVIKILKGSLEYKIAPKGNKIKKEEDTEDDDITIYPTQFILTPTTQNGIIEPERYHKVQAVTGSDDDDNEIDEEELEFVVEFHRVPGTGPVDEKRE
jgi:tellurite resistance-related uncharacterized protein